jgi:hypothetical protein
MKNEGKLKDKIKIMNKLNEWRKENNRREGMKNGILRAFRRILSHEETERYR